MTDSHSPDVDRHRTYFWVSAACLSAGVIFAVVLVAFGVPVRWPSWLCLVAAGVGFAGSAAGPNRPIAQRNLTLAAAIVWIVACILLLVARP